MLSPQLARVSAEPPFDRPAFRGVLLVGDLGGPPAAATPPPPRDSPSTRTPNFEAHLGHLP